MLHLYRRNRKPLVLDKVTSWIDMSYCPETSDIVLVRSILLQKLPMELVDLILDFAEYWPHTTSFLEGPVRAFGPFTWRWKSGKVDYSNVWSPSGPAYAHSWSRWGDSRVENSFIFRSPRLGVRPSRLDPYEGVIPERAYSILTQILARRNKPRNWTAPRGVRVAKKIVFEISCHQDYFGTRGYNPKTVVRLFCDVSINRRSDLRVASSKSLQKDPSGSKGRQKSPEQGPPITYKPLILERWFTPRHSESKTYFIAWNHDDDQPNELPSEEGFPTARDFVKQLEVGDSIGVWARVGEGESYHIIDGMRMQVFWAG